MAAISRAQQLKQLLPGLNALFGDSYKSYGQQHSMIFAKDRSDRSFEEEQKISGFGAAPIKLEGAAVTYDTAQEVWTARYTHETVSMGFSITEEAMEDNLYVSVSKRYTSALARSMAYTKEVKGAAVLNNGFTSYTSGDGVALLATNHPLVTGATIANEPTTATDLNEASLEAAFISISKWTDERGLLIAAKPRKLIIPPDLTFVATRILRSELQPDTAENNINALRTNGTIPEGWVVNNFLTDTDAWYLKTDVPNGFKYFQRVPLKTSMDGDFDTGNVRYKARERYSFGVSDYLCVYGSPGE